MEELFLVHGVRYFETWSSVKINICGLPKVQINDCEYIYIRPY